jgi:hypothetical protein
MLFSMKLALNFLGYYKHELGTIELICIINNEYYG